MSNHQRVFLTRSGQIRLVDEPGRCSTFWQLWQANDRRQISEHLETCHACRVWVERSEKLVNRYTPDHSEPDKELS